MDTTKTNQIKAGEPVWDLAHLQGRYLDGADLVIEVVSDSAEDRNRDLVIKRQEYAQAGISEYWIVDPSEDLVRVLTLSGDAYKLHGEFTSNSTVSSPMFIGFSISVEEISASAN